MSASALHPDQFSLIQYDEPDVEAALSVVRFISLPHRASIVVGGSGPRARMVRLEKLGEIPAWERGRHQVMGDKPEAEQYTGRPLTPRLGQIDLRGSQLDTEGKTR